MTQITHDKTTFTIRKPAEILQDLANGSFRLQVVIYGPPGCGKSRFASTFPCKCGVIDLDKGGLVYTGDHDIATIEPDVKGQGKTATAFKEAEAALNYFIATPDYDGIIIDSCTTLGDACMNYTQQLAGHYGQVPTLPERNAALEHMKNLLTKARASHKHLIVIAHERWERDEVSGRLWCKPAVAGQFSSAMPVYFDETYHGAPKKVGEKLAYQFMTKADSIYTCKSRLDTIVPISEMLDPNFGLILKRIEAKATELRGKQ
jgi:hypothetical protein